ncbi:MAG: serine/threonine protein kinase [Bdellovibrionaceae bacterium]|nr:serine/threonine protein kinase [Pseudobdellovibrionaceae bacterium]
MGFNPTGRYVQLNSYENRVFELECEGTPPAFESPMPVMPTSESTYRLVTKVYRPHRWSRAAIQEEHQFLYALTEEGIPAVAPLKIAGATLFPLGEMSYCLFPKALGRMPQELLLPELEDVGKQLARLHNVGARFKPQHRPTLDTQHYGEQSLEQIQNYIYPELAKDYYQAAEQLLDHLDLKLGRAQNLTIHGDCHKGNILQTDPVGGMKEYFFVDFDDICHGPVVQDFWMLLTDTNLGNNPELDHLLKGYETLRTFNEEELSLIPALQGLRIIYYAGWIAKRWEDPSFKNLFPQYLDYNYWVEELRALEECLRKI